MYFDIVQRVELAAEIVVEKNSRVVGWIRVDESN